MKDKKSKTTTPKAKRPNMRSFEADADVAEMLDDAISAGAVMKEIMNEAIRMHGPEVLKRQVSEMRKKADAIEKKINGGNR